MKNEKLLSRVFLIVFLFFAAGSSDVFCQKQGAKPDPKDKDKKEEKEKPKGVEAAEKIKDAVDEFEKGSTKGGKKENKAIRDEVKKEADKAAKDKPDDEKNVKEKVDKKLEELIEKHSKNKERQDFIIRMRKHLKNNKLVSLPNSSIIPGTQGEVLVAAIGLGQTTGQVGELVLMNYSDLPWEFEGGAFFIPATGNYQSYIVPSLPNVIVPPGTTSSVPFDGFCADVHTPPVPSGEPIIGFDSWIPVQPLPTGWQPDSADGWIQNPNSGILIPGTDDPLNYMIDAGDISSIAASVIAEALKQITKAFGDLKEKEEISTPFGYDPGKEREAVIQQSIWIFSSRLFNKEYKVEDFRNNTIEQFEKNTGMDFETAPPETKENIEKGVVDFWSTFQAVGVEAKVLAKND